MQRNNGAGGGLKKFVKPIYIEFYNSFYNSLTKNAIAHCFYFKQNTVFDNNALPYTLSILQENPFLNNRIVILLSNRSKCVFLQNRHTDSNFVDVNKIGNQTLCKAICWCQQVNFRVNKKTASYCLRWKNNLESFLSFYFLKF